MKKVNKTEKTKQSNVARLRTIQRQVPEQYIEAAADGVWKYIRQHYDMRAHTEVDGFQGDDELTLYIRLCCTDEEFWRISKGIDDHFDFSLND